MRGRRKPDLRAHGTAPYTDRRRPRSWCCRHGRPLRGVYALPAEEVENEETSSVATIIHVEFPPSIAEEGREHQRRPAALPLPHPAAKLIWVGAGGEKLEGSSKLNGLKLDNDGNAFVVVLGGGSCASGVSEIEASLEGARTRPTRPSRSSRRNRLSPTEDRGGGSLTRKGKRGSGGASASGAPLRGSPLAAGAGSEVRPLRTGRRTCIRPVVPPWIAAEWGLATWSMDCTG